MPTEFISLAFPNASTELEPIPGAPIDPDFLKRYAQNLDDYGFNYTLQPYDSSYFDPFTTGATIAAHTKNLKVIIALRPNTVYPTVAAKSLATLDQLSNGRAVVHFIAGGSDAEQAKEGDFLPKDERYARLEEYIKILKRAWAEQKEDNIGLLAAGVAAYPDDADEPAVVVPAGDAPEVIALLVRAGVAVHEARRRRPRLEELFARLTEGAP